MKTIICTLLIGLTLGCTKKKQTPNDTILIEGYLIDQLTNNKFNPFTETKIEFFDEESFKIPTAIATTSADQNGKYSMTFEHSPVGKGFIAINGAVGPSYVIAITHTVSIANKINHDFIIPCIASMYRRFVNQSNTPYDSIIMNVSNSKGISKYKYILTGFRTTLMPELAPLENNYINSKFYANNSFTSRQDTVNPACRTAYRDSIFY